MPENYHKMTKETLPLCRGEERGTKEKKEIREAQWKSQKTESQRKDFKLLTKCRKKKTVLLKHEFSRG